MKKYLLMIFMLLQMVNVIAQHKFEVSVDGYYQQHCRAVDDNIIGLNVTGGYRISDYCRIGIGTGLSDVLSNSTSKVQKESVMFIPLKGQVKVNFLKKGLSPYMGFEGGCCFYLVKDIENVGSTVKCFLGLDIPVNESLSAYCQVGYNSQSICSSYTQKGGFASTVSNPFPTRQPDRNYVYRKNGDLIEIAVGLTYYF